MNNLKKTERQKKQERKTLEGVLINSHKDKLDSVEITTNPEEKFLEKKENKSSFDVKKALLPLAMGTVAVFGGMGLLSTIASKSAKKIMTSKPQECLPDLALNMNIKQEPQFAMYRMLRDPSTKNVIGFGAVVLFSVMTAVLKSFVDGVKKVWIKNQEADIQRDLQENLISVEVESFAGKLDVIRKKVNSVSAYLKNSISDKEENNDEILNVFLDKKITPPFKKNEKNNEKKNKNNNLIYGLVGAGVIGFGLLMGKITFKNLKNITKTANDFSNNYVQKTANSIEELVKGGDKNNIPQIKTLLESIHASKDYISDTLKKLGCNEDEISKITEEITTNSKSIFSDAPTALGGIPKKIQYYCYLDEDRGHLYNWIINPDNKFTKYIFMTFTSMSAMGYLGKEVLDATQKVIVEKEYSQTELNLAKRLVEVEIANFKAKKDSAINPMLEDFKYAKDNGASKEHLEEMADNILFEIKNGPPYVYS